MAKSMKFFGNWIPSSVYLPQSLDYDTAENTLYFKEQKSYSAEVRMQWYSCNIEK